MLNTLSFFGVRLANLAGKGRDDKLPTSRANLEDLHPRVKEARNSRHRNRGEKWMMLGEKKEKIIGHIA